MGEEEGEEEEGQVRLDERWTKSFDGKEVRHSMKKKAKKKKK